MPSRRQVWLFVSSRCLVLSSLCLVLSVLCLAASPAWAQSPGDVSSSESGAAELDTLEKELDDALASLSTADCVIACRALESMTRAAERICVLETGPRCDAARAKVDEANRRVREACPECVAMNREDATRRAEKKPGPVTKTAEPADDDMAPEEESQPGAAPESLDSRGGGCAACSLGQRRDQGWPAWLLLMAALAAAARRKGRSRRR